MTDPTPTEGNVHAAAMAALETYRSHHDGEADASDITDLICDLAHLADKLGGKNDWSDGPSVLNLATIYYETDNDKQHQKEVR